MIRKREIHREESLAHLLHHFVFRRNHSNPAQGDRNSISSGKTSADLNPSPTSGDEGNSVSAEEARRVRSNSATGNIFTNIKRIFAPNMLTTGNDSFNRTSTYCLYAAVPTRELNHWVKIQLSYQLA